MNECNIVHINAIKICQRQREIPVSFNGSRLSSCTMITDVTSERLSMDFSVIRRTHSQ